jgi:hypothetical protein
MTTSQPARRTVADAPLRRVLGRSLRALRKMHDEEVYAWGRYLRAGLPPEGGPEAAAKARGRAAGSRSPVPADSASGDRAA